MDIQNATNPTLRCGQFFVLIDGFMREIELIPLFILDEEANERSADSDDRQGGDAGASSESSHQTD